jgi:hypothetical protein
VLAWAVLSGHSSLRGFQILVKTSDGKMFKDVAVTRSADLSYISVTNEFVKRSPKM